MPAFLSSRAAGLVARAVDPGGSAAAAEALAAADHTFDASPAGVLAALAFTVKHNAALWFALFALICIAYLTNPSPASFRTHLTSLSFQTHLRALSPAASTTKSTPTSPGAKRSSSASASTNSKHRTASPSSSNSPATTTSSPRPTDQLISRPSESTVLSFSSRISLAIRTPKIAFASYALFSVATVPRSDDRAEDLSDDDDDDLVGEGDDEEEALETSSRAHANSRRNASAAQQPTRGRGRARANSKRGGQAPGAQPSAPSQKKGAATKRATSVSGANALKHRNVGKLHAAEEDAKARQASSRGRQATRTACRRPAVEQVFLGIFGTWFDCSAFVLQGSHGAKGDVVDSERARARRVEKGLLNVEVEDDDKKTVSSRDEESPVPSSTDRSRGNSISSNAASAPVTPANGIAQQEAVVAAATAAAGAQARTTARPSKRLVFRAGQRRSSPTSLARLRSKAEAVAALNSPTSPTDEKGPFGGEKDDEDGSEEKHEYESNVDKASSSAGGGAGNSGERANPIIEELQKQIEDLRHTADDTEKRLQGELATLRERKKDEDSLRAELKSRSRELEEQKRAADATRGEAEREIGDKRATMREIESRLEDIRLQLRAIDRKEKELADRKDKKRRERIEKERRLREEIAKKRDELKQAEQGVAKIYAKAHQLEQSIANRRERLESKRAEMLSGVSRFAVPAEQSSSNPFGLFRRASKSGQRPQSDVDLSSFPSNYFTTGYAPPSNSGSFYEHRLQHHASNGPSPASSQIALPGTLSQMPPGTLPSTRDISAFEPFDTQLRSSSSYDDFQAVNRPRPPLSLPMQYLDNGLLPGEPANSDDPLLSPMTPHQTSLIPSQLFHMLDDDEDDDFGAAALDSPSRTQQPTAFTASNSNVWNGRMMAAALDSPASPSSLNEASRTSPAIMRRGSADEAARRSPADLPRGTLSLNPDAKSFDFLTGGVTHGGALASPTSSMMASPVSSPPATVEQGSTDSFGAPTVPAPTSLASLKAPPASASSRFSFASTSGDSGDVSPGASRKAFNPFNEEDELLGPLKE